MNLIDRVATFSGFLSATEMGLGAWIHALRFPLGGQLLSLNQGFLLSISARGLQRKEAVKVSYGVSSVSALLKSLSPMGKRLTPMLAIWTQGVLFSFGIGIGGTGRLGLIIANMIASLWSFVQPALLALAIFGLDPLAEWVKLFPTATQYLGWIIAFGVLLKLVVASALGLIASKIPEEKLTQYFVLTKYANHTQEKKRLGYSLWIAMTVAMGLGMFFIHGESSVASFVSYVLRPVTVCLVLFYGTNLLLRLLNLKNVARRFPVIGTVFLSLHKE